MKRNIKGKEIKEMVYGGCEHKNKLVEYFKGDGMKRYRCMKCKKKWEEDKLPAIVFYMIHKQYSDQKNKGR
jgi:transposase-like protein